jgi:hypothetical protein
MADLLMEDQLMADFHVVVLDDKVTSGYFLISLAD